MIDDERMFDTDIRMSGFWPPGDRNQILEIPVKAAFTGTKTLGGRLSVPHLLAFAPSETSFIMTEQLEALPDWTRV